MATLLASGGSGVITQRTSQLPKCYLGLCGLRSQQVVMVMTGVGVCVCVRPSSSTFRCHRNAWCLTYHLISATTHAVQPKRVKKKFHFYLLMSIKKDQMHNSWQRLFSASSSPKPPLVPTPLVSCPCSRSSVYYVERLTPWWWDFSLFLLVQGAPPKASSLLGRAPGRGGEVGRAGADFSLAGWPRGTPGRF